MPTSTGLNTKKMDSKKNLFIYKKMKINFVFCCLRSRSMGTGIQGTCN